MVASSARATAENRMAMERCLTKNFLLKFGMNFFGKRDLIYIDMKDSNDVERADKWEIGPDYNGILVQEAKEAAAAEKAAKAAAKAAKAEEEGGDDEDGGDDDE